MALSTVSWKDYTSKYIKEVSATPYAEISIGEKTWKSSNKGTFISRVETVATTGCEASVCDVEFTASGKERLEKDFSQVKVGVKLKISLGYEKTDGSNDSSPVFVGYISSFDIEMDKKNDSVTLTIRGMDAKMWLMSNCKTELKKGKKKYSAVVTGIYSKYAKMFDGNSIKITGEVDFEKLIYQVEESDYEFLCRVAQFTGSLFFVNLGKLYFVNPVPVKGKTIKIEPEEGIYNLRVSMSVWGIPKAVEAIGIDPKNFQKVITAKATSSEIIGKGKAGTSLTKNIGTQNVIKIIDNTISSVKEAKFIAQAQYNKREFDLVECRLETAGNPAAQLGGEIKLTDFDDPVDNSYMITGIEHMCDLSKSEYITRLRLNTNRYSP